MSLGNAIKISQTVRDTAHMFARGINFDRTDMQDIAVRLAGNLNMARTGGDGVLIFSKIITPTQQDCDAANRSTNCPNKNRTVLIHRVVVGSTSLQASHFGTPASSIVSTDGNISTLNYLTHASAIATGFDAELCAGRCLLPLHLLRRSIMRQERGFALMLFGAMAIPTIALVGLAVDTGVIYLIKSKLSAAVDAGSLAGARALSRGNDDATQRTRAQQVATAYLRANFPQGYLMSGTLTIPTPTVDSSIANQRSVSLTATVEAPVFFMRIVGAAGTTVRADATAVRRDVNVMLVLDRSGSLQTSNSCDELRAAAIGFVQKFAPGRDNLGLVTYATSSFTEFPMGNNFATAATTLETRISRIVCNGATSSAAGLALGYWELAGLNEPAALNVILFFTDGQPTAIGALFPINAASPCPAQYRGNSTFPGVWRTS